jgi:hypothetical protein
MKQVTDLSDPNRCQGAAPDGQCRNRAEPEDKYCRLHGSGQRLAEQQAKRGFLLAKATDKARLSAVSEELEPVKELRDSIALQHMLIEKRYNLIQSDADLLASCGPLNQMLQTMERLVTSCHRIETNLGELLAKHAIVALAKDMVEIVVDELEGIPNYEEIIDRITVRLIDTVQGANNNPPEAPLMLPPPPTT